MRFDDRRSGPQMTNATACEITPLILTFDEAPNIGRSLSKLTWAQRIVVLDSCSNDRTVEIARGFPNVVVLERRFDTHMDQWNHGLALVDSAWTLALDADYIVPARTSAEIIESVATQAADGYYARLTYCVRGKLLRHAVLPPRLVLFRTRAGRFHSDGHTQRLKLEGRAARLEGDILHDDRKSLRRWLWAQDRYADLEVEKLLSTSSSELLLQDRIRKAAVIAPWLVPAYYLFAKGGLRDGWAGLDYAAQRAVAELVLSIKLIERLRIGVGDDDACGS